ncbi:MULTISPECIES: U32 family peptidase [unclassified Janthinobacterium]|uniref:U32 family peptidase n=1 Tax=unclassified Janthinobacterium TaxID=2610881 RepID=UPI000346D888|nr:MULTISPECIES: U32 family peptidase [unclassified Janthinobacterium]MEC5162078.1 collagenase-like PrtC family protease [Janthinobacterium sp. CG_S6]
MKPLKISLAPLAHYWSKADTLRFYAEARYWPVDIIYLGEVVCSRRHLMQSQDWFALAQDLRAAGKQVVMATLLRVDNDADRHATEALVERAVADGLQLEANCFGVVRAIRAMQGQSFVAGPSLNAHHEGILSWLAMLGASRFQPPPGLPLDVLGALQQRRPAGMQTEVSVWGQLALEFNAHCFSARDGAQGQGVCDFRCQGEPRRLPAQTGRRGAGLPLAGENCVDMFAQVPALRSLGVEIIRVQPQAHGMAALLKAFDGARQPLRFGVESIAWMGQSSLH